MRLIGEFECPKCHTLVRVIEGGTKYPWRELETADCPVCGTPVYEAKTTREFETEILSKKSANNSLD